jgi:hypothetical protein
MRPPDFGNSANRKMSGSLGYATSPICLEEVNTRGDDNRMPASTCLIRAASKACSKIGDPHFYDFSFECERPHHRLGRGKLRRVKAGMPKIALRESRGTISSSNPTCFPLNSGRSRNMSTAHRRHELVQCLGGVCGDLLADEVGLSRTNRPRLNSRA